MVDSVNVGGNPHPDAESKQAEHDAAMAAKAEEGVSSISSVNKQTDENINLEAGEAKVAERPADIPEKFWDAEAGTVNVQALLKAQQDGEAALRQAQQKPEDKTTDADDAPKGESESQQNAIDKAAAEFAEKGELSPEAYESLEQAGITKSMVDTYISGQQAVVAQLESAAYGEFDGTSESYQEAVQWAAANLSNEEIDALDVQLTSDNPAIVKQGAKALAARYQADADVTPGRTISGATNTGSTGSYFKSSHEMQKAMADPRYSKDAAFRQEVSDKIARADRAGVSLFG